MRRLALEHQQGAAIVEREADRVAAMRTERQVIAAWRKWYREALEPVRTLLPGGAG